jgi:methylated-DNA-protein-cysteine methyltransferase related protein
MAAKVKRTKPGAKSVRWAGGSWEPVYTFVKGIPRGHVISYGELAAHLRLPGGARTAGFAIAATPRGRGIPWHRVVGAGGCIRLGEPLASLQRRLLETEGVQFVGSRIDFERHHWRPGRGVRGTKRGTKKVRSRRRV